MKRFPLPTTHHIELIHNPSEVFRLDRLQRVATRSIDSLCAKQVVNIHSIQDHKGLLTLTLIEEEQFTEELFKSLWEKENEHEFTCVIYIEPDTLPF